MSKQKEALKSIIEHFYHWEKTSPNKVFLRQPKGDTWHTLTYAEAGQKIAALDPSGQSASEKVCESGVRERGAV